jgi:hypothetical protein
MNGKEVWNSQLWIVFHSLPSSKMNFVCWTFIWTWIGQKFSWINSSMLRLSRQNQYGHHNAQNTR